MGHLTRKGFSKELSLMCSSYLDVPSIVPMEVVKESQLFPFEMLYEPHCYFIEGLVRRDISNYVHEKPWIH